MRSGVRVCSGVFWKVLVVSGGQKPVQKRFLVVAGDFWGVLVGSDGSSGPDTLPEKVSGGFWRILVRSNWVWCFQKLETF
jgi:hypothetical protein